MTRFTDFDSFSLVHGVDCSPSVVNLSQSDLGLDLDNRRYGTTEEIYVIQYDVTMSVD